MSGAAAISSSRKIVLTLAAAGAALAAVPALADGDGDYRSTESGYGRPDGNSYNDDGYRTPAGAYDGYGERPNTLEGLTVRPRSRVVGRDSATGAPIEQVRISRVVSYSDLDLRTGWGADELVRRIDRAARSACDEMDFLHPISTGDDPPCVRAAVNDAMYQARAAIAGARGW